MGGELHHHSAFPRKTGQRVLPVIETARKDSDSHFGGYQQIRKWWKQRRKAGAEIANDATALRNICESRRLHDGGSWLYSDPYARESANDEERAHCGGAMLRRDWAMRLIRGGRAGVGRNRKSCWTRGLVSEKLRAELRIARRVCRSWCGWLIRCWWPRRGKVSSPRLNCPPVRQRIACRAGRRLRRASCRERTLFACTM